MRVCVFSENQNYAWTPSCGCGDFPKWRVAVSAWSPWECKLPLNSCSWISSVHPKWQHEMFVSLKVGSDFCFSILMVRLFLRKSSLGMSNWQPNLPFQRALLFSKVCVCCRSLLMRAVGSPLLPLIFFF